MVEKGKGKENIDNPVESSCDNTLDYLLGDELVAFGAFIDFSEIIRERDPDIDPDFSRMLYAQEKGLKDTLKDMRVAIGAIDRAYKLVPTGHKHTPDKEPTTCEKCGKKYDWQDIVRLENIHGKFPCNECGAELKFRADTHQKEA